MAAYCWILISNFDGCCEQWQLWTRLQYANAQLWWLESRNVESGESAGACRRQHTIASRHSILVHPTVSIYNVWCDNYLPFGILIVSSTSSGTNDFQQIYADQSVDEIIDKDSPISFIVHGYLASIRSSRKLTMVTSIHRIEVLIGFLSAWMERIARVWSTKHQRVICLVDWRRLAAFDYATASLKHTQTVGFYMAKLIGSMPLSRIKKISIVGHSLGAHVAGYCGQALNGSIQYIYGNLLTFLRKTRDKIINFFSRPHRSRSGRSTVHAHLCSRPKP